MTISKKRTAGNYLCWILFSILLALCAAMTMGINTAQADEHDSPIASEQSTLTTAAVSTTNVYRLYNQWSGEHLYTTDFDEYMKNGSQGWTLEGVGWTAPSKSNTPVYRLYNKWSGDHHYTTDFDEYQARGNDGWSQEGTAWYSDDNKTLPVYRLYNQYVSVGTHHFTTKSSEYNGLKTNGWTQEGVAWYAVGDGWGESSEVQNLAKIQGWWNNYSHRTYLDNGVTTMKSHMIHIVNDKAYIYRNTTTLDRNGSIAKEEISGPESLGTISTVGVGRNIKVTFSADPREYCYYFWPFESDNLSKQSDGFMTATSLVRTPEASVPQEYLSRSSNER